MFSLFRRSQQQPIDLLEPEQLLHKAMYLLKTGHPIPAGMTARVSLELLIRSLYKEYQPKGDIYGTRMRAQKLSELGIFPQKTTRGILNMLEVGNKAAHGLEVNFSEIRGMIRCARAVVHAYREGRLDGRRKAVFLRRQARLLLALADGLNPTKLEDAPETNGLATV